MKAFLFVCSIVSNFLGNLFYLGIYCSVILAVLSAVYHEFITTGFVLTLAVIGLVIMYGIAAFLQWEHYNTGCRPFYKEPRAIL